MPADPGANLGKRKMPTKEKDIGHVAPSFESPKFYNSLVVRPEYRISLELGNISDLFVHKQDSLKGKMERMQVAALFYFPMNHKKAEDAVKFGWKYYKEKILEENDDKKGETNDSKVCSRKLHGTTFIVSGPGKGMEARIVYFDEKTKSGLEIRPWRRVKLRQERD